MPIKAMITGQVISIVVISKICYVLFDNGSEVSFPSEFLPSSAVGGAKMKVILGVGIGDVDVSVSIG